MLNYSDPLPAIFTAPPRARRLVLSERPGAYVPFFVEAIFLAAVALLLAVEVPQVQQAIALSTDGIDVDGWVVGKTFYRAGRSDLFKIDFEYVDRSGQRYTKAESVDPRTGDSVHRDQHVMVRYLPQNPEVAVVGFRGSSDAARRAAENQVAMHLYILGLFGALAVVVQPLLIWLPVRNFFLIKNGTAVRANVLEVTKIRQQNLGEVCRVTYQFQPKTGSPVTQTKRVSADEFDDYQNKKTVLVFHENNGKYCSVLYDESIFKLKD